MSQQPELGKLSASSKLPKVAVLLLTATLPSLLMKKALLLGTDEKFHPIPSWTIMNGRRKLPIFVFLLQLCPLQKPQFSILP